MDNRPHKDTDLLKYRAGNRALWAASRNYLGIICGSIFAIILARPEALHNNSILSIPMHRLVEWYLIIGIVGIFMSELKSAVAAELEQSADEMPMWIKKLFSAYTLAGIAIFWRLLSAFLAT